MTYKIFSKLLPVEVINLIKGDGWTLVLLFIIGGMVAFLIGLELICLYLLGKVLLEQSIPIEAGSLFIFIANYLENLPQSQMMIILGCAFSFVILLRYGFILLYDYMSLKWTALVTVRLQNRGMESILFAPVSIYDKRKLGGIIHGLMDLLGSNYYRCSYLAHNCFYNCGDLLALIYISPWMVLGAMVLV